MAQEVALDKSVKTVTVNLGSKSKFSGFAHPIVRVDIRYPPAFIRVLLTDPKSSPLPPCIIAIPTINFLLWLLRQITECVELLDLPKFTSPCSDAIIDISSFLFIREAEANKVEISAAKPY